MAGFGNFVPVYCGFGAQSFADEGSYFTALNTTPGTGIAGHAAPTTADSTKPLIYIKNNNARGGPRLWLDYIGIRITAIGTGGTAVDWSVFLDDTPGVPAGGSAITPRSTKQRASVNPQDSLIGSNAVINFGAGVITNGAGVKHVAHRRTRAAISVVEDYTSFSFGVPGNGIMTTGAATVTAFHVAWPAIAIEPGAAFLLVNWQPAQSAAASFDIEVGYVER